MSEAPQADIALAGAPRVCLTALVPAAQEDRLVDWLLAHEGWHIEFSVHAVAARGPLVHLAAGEERVQGYARRVEVKLIVERERLQPLLDALNTLLQGVDGGYWVVPVERYGAFARRPQATRSEASR